VARGRRAPSDQRVLVDEKTMTRQRYQSFEGKPMGMFFGWIRRPKKIEDLEISDALRALLDMPYATRLGALETMDRQRACQVLLALEQASEPEFLRLLKDLSHNRLEHFLLEQTITRRRAIVTKAGIDVSVSRYPQAVWGVDLPHPEHGIERGAGPLRANGPSSNPPSQTGKSDASLAQDARATIAAIAARCSSVDAPKLLAAKRELPRAAVRTGDAYVDSCLASGLEESEEPRDAFAMDDVKPAAILGSGAGRERDVELAKSLIARYPDLDLPYYWLSHHYLLREDFQTARAILDEGMSRCRRKRKLCYEYGCVEREAKSPLHAVKWWTRDAVLQLRSGTRDGYGSFMYLAYVAQFCGLRREAEKLFAVTDAIRSIRLNSSGQQEIYSMVCSADTDPIVKVIRILVREYVGTQT
jgi:hypothetical protein